MVTRELRFPCASTSAPVSVTKRAHCSSTVCWQHFFPSLDWNYATKQNLFITDRYFKEYKQERQGEEAVQIVTSGPDSKWQNIRNVYLKMISKARKYIYIQTPYFIPDETIMNAIRIAAMSGTCGSFRGTLVVKAPQSLTKCFLKKKKKLPLNIYYNFNGTIQSESK